MAQSGSSLYDDVKSGLTKVYDTVMSLPTPTLKKDTTDKAYADKMVQDANASFRRKAASEAAAKKQGHSYKAAQAEHKKVAARK